MNPRERYAALLKELTELRAKAKAGTLTEDEGKTFDAKVEELKALKAEIEALDRRSGDADFLDAEDRRMNQPAAGQRVAGIATSDQQRRLDRRETRERPGEAQSKDATEARGIANRFFASEQWQQFAQRGHPERAKVDPAEVRSFFHRDGRGPQLEHLEGMGPKELLTLIYTGALPDDFIAPYRVPGVYTPDMPDLTVRNAFLNLQTTADAIFFFRELAFTNNAAFVAEATATAGASGLKPESALTFERDDATVETLAHWIPVTNQMLQDEPTMRGVIEGRLIDGLRLVEDEAILNGDGIAPNIEGLETVSGTQDASDAYFTTNPVSDAGQANEDINRLLRGRRLVREVGRATPTFILMSPGDEERILSLTDANRQYMVGGGPFGASAVTTIWRLPVIVTEALDDGEAWIGDGRMAAVFDRMAASISVGLIDDQFVRNMQTILAEERLAFAVFRPAAFVKVTLTSAA